MMINKYFFEQKKNWFIKTESDDALRETTFLVQ